MKIGDLVKHKGDSSPAMVVIDLNPDLVQCSYFNPVTGLFVVNEFRKKSLYPVSEESTYNYREDIKPVEYQKPPNFIVQRDERERRRREKLET